MTRLRAANETQGIDNGPHASATSAEYFFCPAKRWSSERHHGERARSPVAGLNVFEVDEDVGKVHGRAGPLE